MPKPLLIIINGPPGAGKTTLARRLATDLRLPVIHRVSIAETLFDGLDCQAHGRPALIGPASFKLMHYFAGVYWQQTNRSSSRDASIRPN